MFLTCFGYLPDGFHYARQPIFIIILHRVGGCFFIFLYWLLWSQIRVSKPMV